MKTLLTVKDIAQQIGASERKVCEFIKAGNIPAKKICGKWVTTTDALTRYVEGENINC